MQGTSDTSDGIDQWERSENLKSWNKLLEKSFGNKSFYSESIDQYMSGKKPSLRRRVIYHTITVNALMVSIFNLALNKHPEREGIKYLGTPLTLIFYDDKNWLTYVIFFWLSFLLFNSHMFYSNQEKQFLFHPFDFYYAMKYVKSDIVERIKFRPISFAMAKACTIGLNKFDDY